MDIDEVPAEAAAPPSSNDTGANMENGKASIDASGVEDGIPESGGKPLQTDTDTKVSTVEKIFMHMLEMSFSFFMPLLIFLAISLLFISNMLFFLLLILWCYGKLDDGTIV